MTFPPIFPTEHKEKYTPQAVRLPLLLVGFPSQSDGPDAKAELKISGVFNVQTLVTVMRGAQRMIRSVCLLS